MTPCSPTGRVMLYEPRVEGHHLSWLRYISEDLLSAGFELVLALDQSPAAKKRIQETLPEVLGRVRVIVARDDKGWASGRGGASAVGRCFAQSGAEEAFLCTVDEISSDCLRRAAIGLMPPAALRGRMSGIYIRPRFLAERRFTPNHLLKRFGYARLFQQGWFKRILLLDEFLHAELKRKAPAAPYFFLPDPGSEYHGPARREARIQLGLPQEARIFLYFGGPYRRKGLDLAVEAMSGLPENHRAFLLCIGQQPEDARMARRLAALVAAKRAVSINRYVSDAEMQAGFGASDVVLLPYRGHFGSSSVLSQAAAAGRPVIASDEQLVGQRVRVHKLGLLFATGDAAGLREAIDQMTVMEPAELGQWLPHLEKFAAKFSREGFRRSILESFGAGRAQTE